MIIPATIQIQKLPSSKVWFKKYVYKIEGKYPKANRIIHALRFNHPVIYGVNDKPVSSDPFARAITPYIGRSDIKIRTESTIFGIYTSELKDVEEICVALGAYVKNVYGPTTEQERNFLLTESRKKILRDKLPHDQFRFRVVLKGSWDEETRKKVYKWMSPYLKSERARLTKETDRYLRSVAWCLNPIIYIKNESDLSMFLLYISNQVKLIEEFVLRSEIMDQA